MGKMRGPKTPFCGAAHCTVTVPQTGQGTILLEQTPVLPRRMPVSDFPHRGRHQCGPYGAYRSHRWNHLDERGRGTLGTERRPDFPGSANRGPECRFQQRGRRRRDGLRANACFKSHVAHTRLNLEAAIAPKAFAKILFHGSSRCRHSDNHGGPCLSRPDSSRNAASSPAIKPWPRGFCPKGFTCAGFSCHNKIPDAFPRHFRRGGSYNGSSHAHRPPLCSRYHGGGRRCLARLRQRR